MEIDVWRALAYTGYYTGVSRLWRGANNVVLGFHSVHVDDQYPYGVSEQRFREIVGYVAEHHVPVDLPGILGKREKRVAFTFDDGYQGFYDNALSILEEFQVPATVFVNPDFIDGENVKTKLANLRNAEPVMTAEQIEDLVDHPLITIGNHTRTHHLLSPHRNREVLHDEIVGAKELLEDRFGISVDRFCYPYGGYNSTSKEIAQNSHTYVIKERRGQVGPDSSATRLPRVNAERGWASLLWDTADVSEWFRHFQ